MTHQRIVIIGGGNMGRAVLQALLHAPGVSARQVTVVEHNPKQQKVLASEFSVQVVAELTPVTLARVTAVLVAVKPQDFSSVATQIRKYIPKNSLLISIMAGVHVSTLRSATSCSRIVRVMPNLPMVVGEGCSAWYASRGVAKAQRVFTRALFGAGGEQLEIHNEGMFDAITAVSGSGPAYVFSFAADLMQAARQLGLPAEIAKKLVLQTLKGSVALLAEYSDSAEEWRARVTSKGGTTEAAFRVLHKVRLDKLWLRALRAAARRSQAISTLIDGTIQKNKYE